MMRPEPVLGLQAAALGAHLQRRQRRRVVDEDAGGRQVRVGAGQPRPVLFLQVARAQPVRVDPGVGAQHAQHQLLLGHLEREHAHRLPRLGARVLGDVQAERRLPHRGTRGDDDEVALLQAARHLVEVDEAGGDAGDELAALGELVDGAEALLDDLPDLDEALPDPPFRDVEDGLLGPVQQHGRLVLRLVRGVHDAVAGVDQVPEDRLLLDDARPVLDVGQPRETVEQGREVRGAPDRLQRRAARELVLERDQVDRLAALRKYGHGVEDAAVRLAVEVVAGEQLCRRVERAVVDQHGAQDGPLRLVVLRERLVLEYGFGRQGALRKGR